MDKIMLQLLFLGILKATLGCQSAMPLGLAQNTQFLANNSYTDEIKFSLTLLGNASIDLTGKF